MLVGPLIGGYVVEIIGFKMASFWIVVSFLITVSLLKINTFLYIYLIIFTFRTFFMLCSTYYLNQRQNQHMKKRLHC